jgi:DNA-binding MarR family transcriptional regulator
MTRAQCVLLLRLACNPGMSQKELADALEVEPISVARLLDRLEAAGLVERRADQQDRRIWRLHLRPAATDKLDNICRQRKELADYVTAGLPDALREAMVEGLRLMKANLLRSANTQPERAEPAGQIKEKT